jgi:hypothetical protein
MARTVEVKPRNDAYTGLLAISFLALVAGCLLMLLDAQELGDPPTTKLNIDVPGVTPGKATAGLRRPDAGKIEGAPADKGGAPDAKGGTMGRAEPGRLPDLAAVTVPGVVVPASAEAPADPDGPPLPVKAFDPPK